MVPKSGNNTVTLEAVQSVEHELAILHPPSFQITGDNLDMFIKAKHMTSTHQNSSIHWFNLNAILNHVHANHLSNERPIKSVLEIGKVDFLPSCKDNQDFLHYAAVLCGRVLISNVPAFRSFKDIVV